MSIDLCYETAISRLSSSGKIVSISKKILTLQSNDEKVLYVAEILRDLNLYPNIEVVAKSDNVSTYYRNLGNKFFQKSEDYEAWQYYNLSLLHSPLESENLATALANRSAVFFSFKKYQECLKDIREVFSRKYPEKIRDKLLKREAQCKENIQKCNTYKNKQNKNEDIENLLTFTGAKDEIFLCASNKLKVVHNKEMGRHVIAKEDIKVGEILAQEDPYFTLLLKTQLFFSCSYCLSRKLNLLPCDNCCFALYCSMECKQNALKDYHKVECPLMPTLLKMEFTKLELLALRTVIKARTEHSDWDSLLKTVETAEENVNTKYHGCVIINNKWVYDSKYYTSVHTLASNIEKRSISDIFQKSVTAAVFLYLLLEKTNFLKVPSEKKHVITNFVAGALLLHTMTAPTNMHGLRSNIQGANGDFVDEVNLASAPYAFLSLLNHSCAPNVVRFSKLGTGRMTLFALRPIKKGMQIYDNYGSHHALDDRRTRHEAIKFQYKFDCACEACINNWPTYLRLRPAKNLPPRITKLKDQLLSSDSIEKLQKGDKIVALKLYKPLCELAQILDPYAPCVELADCQESLKQCLAIFEGFVPYGYRKLIEWTPLPPV